MIETIRCNLRVEGLGIETRTGDRVTWGPLYAPPEPPPQELRWGDKAKEFYWWRLDEDPVQGIELLDENGRMAFPLSTDLIAYRGEARSEWLDADILVNEFLESYGDEERIRQRIPHLISAFGPLGSNRCIAFNPNRSHPYGSISAAEPFDEWAGNIARLARVMGAAKLCGDIRRGKGTEVLASLRYIDESKGGFPDIQFPFTYWVNDDETSVRYESLFSDTNDQLRFERIERDHTEEEVNIFLKRYIETWLVEMLKGQQSLSMVNFEPVYKPASLKGMLWEMVRRMVSDDKRIFGICPKCSKPWSRTGRKAKPNARFCGPDCSNAAKSQAYRDRMKENG